MGYVPNLIPEQHRVELKGPLISASANTPSLSSGDLHSIWKIPLYVLASFVFLMALGTFTQSIIAALILASLGFILLPEGMRFTEQMVLRRALTRSHKFFLAFVLFVIALVAIGVSAPPPKGSTENTSAITAVDTAEIHKQRLARAEADHKEKQRKDSLSYFVEKARKSLSKKAYPAAVTSLNMALRYATTERSDIISRLAGAKLKAGLYNDALKYYNELISAKVNVPENLCDRALCLNNLKRKQDAITDLKMAMALKSERAEKMYDKLNPVKRRIAYYVTRCCDGSTSHAKGRGACSHHGGVCDWNEPVYEEYREYE